MEFHREIHFIRLFFSSGYFNSTCSESLRLWGDGLDSCFCLFITNHIGRRVLFGAYPKERCHGRWVFICFFLEYPTCSDLICCCFFSFIIRSRFLFNLRDHLTDEGCGVEHIGKCIFYCSNSQVDQRVEYQVAIENFSFCSVDQWFNRSCFSL